MAFSVQAYKLLGYAQMVARTYGAHGVYTSDLLKGLVYLLREDKPSQSTLQIETSLRHSEAAIHALKLAGKEAMADRCPLQPYHVLLGMTLVAGKAGKSLSLMGLNAEKLRKHVFHLEKEVYLSENILKQIRQLDIARIDYESQSVDEPLSPYEEVMWVDPDIYPLVCALNQIRGVRTNSSCEGHRNDDPASVDFECPISFSLPLRWIAQRYEGFVVVQISAVDYLGVCKGNIQIHYRGMKEVLYRIQRELIKQLEDFGLLTEHGRIAFIPLENWLRECTSKKYQHRREPMGCSRKLKCSFCGRDEDKVQKLIGASGVFICDVCVLEIVKALGEEHLPIFEEMLEVITSYQGG